MRVDFYQLSRDPADKVVPLLARAARQAGARLLVVSDETDQLERIGKALWDHAPTTFLANGQADDAHAAHHPILLGHDVEATNDARFVVLADGKWRDRMASFERIFLLFGNERLEDARACWRKLGEDETIERHFWKQEGGKWNEMG